ncbi:hypothetical protein NL676_002526 [Syzygium grande]|nr:hypothetical protein NL676_002526 [Syzygium grande]
MLVLLQKALDPPDPDVVQDALDLLVHMGALQTSQRGRLEPTFYGRLLASLSLSFEASMLVIKFGEVGLLHEGILLGVLMDKQSLPIIHFFGEDDSFTKYLDNYFSRDTNKPPNRSSKGDEDVLSSLHRFRPNFLGASEGFPSYYYPCDFQHKCLLECRPNEDEDEDEDAAGLDDEELESSADTRECVAMPFVAPNDFQTKYVADKLTAVVKEIKAHYFGLAPGDQPKSSSESRFSVDKWENSDADPALLIRLFPFADDGNILILDDTTFHFTSNIARSYDPFRMVATTRLLESSISDPSLTDVKIMWGLHHPYQTIIGKSAESQVLWKSVKCVLWFPDFEVCGHKKNFEGQRSFIKNFFEYLAIRVLADALCEVPVVLTMNNLRFSKLQVEKLGRSSFFFLTESFPFAGQSFGELSDVMPTKKLMEVSKPISYVFRLYPPPTDVKPDDFQAAIRKCLHDVQ